MELNGKRNDAIGYIMKINSEAGWKSNPSKSYTSLLLRELEAYCGAFFHLLGTD